MTEPELQTAIVQTSNSAVTEGLPLVISHCVAIPNLPSEHHVLVQVLAVALNPTDYKNPIFLPSADQGAGSDFCGIVTKTGSLVSNAATTGLPLGARVCGAVFPYNQEEQCGETNVTSRSGAFAEWVVADGRLLLRVPDHWDDLQGAGLGGIGWGTAALALSDLDALGLEGMPSRRAEMKEPVLVYGGATATGTMACQMLHLSGYSPLTITSAQSANLAMQYGAVGTAFYTSPTCAETIRNLAGVPIRHVLDCITSPESVATCFAAMARTGGRYACLEAMNEAWRTRRLIRVKEVMGYEGMGINVRLGSASSTYSRGANPTLFALSRCWKVEIQTQLDAGYLKHHPIQEIPGKWEGIIHGLAQLKRGEVRRQKLVVRLGS